MCVPRKRINTWRLRVCSSYPGHSSTRSSAQTNRLLIDFEFTYESEDMPQPSILEKMLSGKEDP